MFDLKIDQLKANFFDRSTVMNAVGRAARRVLSRFGAFVRQRAKTSIRKRKRVSDPGRPPSSHLGLLRKFIFFAYEPGRESVIIGPAKLNQRGNAPELLEYGGDTTRSERGKTRTLHYRARPFMHPALAAEQDKLPAMWRDSVK